MGGHNSQSVYAKNFALQFFLYIILLLQYFVLTNERLGKHLKK